MKREGIDFGGVDDDLTGVDEPESGSEGEGFANRLANLDDDGPRAQEYFNPLEGLFCRVLLDEGHKCRNPRTNIAEAIRGLKAPWKWVMSATPMLNRAVDFTAYLHMFWKPEWNIDEVAENNDNRTFHFYKTHCRPLYTPIYAPGGELDLHAQNMPLWRLNPAAYSKYISQQDVAVRVRGAYDVLRLVIPLLMLRRTQATRFQAFGREIRIGDSIPPYHICTVELGFGDKLAEHEYRREFNKAVEYLHSGANFEDGDGSRLSDLHGVRDPYAIASGNTGTRSFAAHRKLGILTFNPALASLIKRTGKNNMVSHVEKWYNEYDDLGMSLYFHLTKPDRNLPMYADRTSFAQYIAKDSPKLQYLAKLMNDICLAETDPGRALIFTDWPVNQWNCQGFLAVRLQTFV